MKQFFYKENSVSVLFIGKMVHDEAFLALAKTVCNPLHVATTEEEIEKIVLEHNIDCIFGTLVFENLSYFNALEKVRAINPNSEIVLFLELCDGVTLDKVRSLKRSQHFCAKTQEKYALEYLKSTVGMIAKKNLLLKATQYFSSLMEASIVSQSDTQGNITYVNENFTKML